MDELVVEHTFENNWSLGFFRRLVRRNRVTGAVQWEVGPEKFLHVDNQRGSLLIPSCPLDKPIDWCTVMEWSYTKSGQYEQSFWKLDLGTGELSDLALPSQLTVTSANVASDGQTLVFEDGYTRTYYGDSPDWKKTTDVCVWHPERKAEVLLRLSRPLSEVAPITLPGRRVLVVEAHGHELKIQIIPLDGGDPRQIYP